MGAMGLHSTTAPLCVTAPLSGKNGEGCFPFHCYLLQTSETSPLHLYLANFIVASISPYIYVLWVGVLVQIDYKHIKKSAFLADCLVIYVKVFCLNAKHTKRCPYAVQQFSQKTISNTI